MIIFGHTPKEWKRRFLNSILDNPWLWISYIVVFILGALIF